MSSSPALKALFAAAILLTVSLKILVGDAAGAGPGDDVEKYVADFLGRHDFQVLDYSPEQGPFLPAVSGNCRIGVAQATAQGWNRDALHLFAKTEDRLFFVYNGAIYPDQPTTRTAIRYQWTRFLRKIGIGVSWRPVFAVTSSASCHADSLPWAELATVP